MQIYRGFIIRYACFELKVQAGPSNNEHFSKDQISFLQKCPDF